MTETPTNQPDRAGEGELDRILHKVSEEARQAIRDYRDHKEPKPQELTHIEAKAAIAAYVDDKVRRELQSLPRYSYPTENNIDREAVPAYVIDARIAELTAAPVGSQDGEGDHGDSK